MAKMRAVQFKNKGSSLELVEKEIPEPKEGWVRIKVQACGICHSDSFVKDGAFPGMSYPRVPGHEIAGLIDALAPGVTTWKVGQKVGVGWNGGYCVHCLPCRRGDFVNCSNLLICGISYDGGYADYIVVPQEALALIPEGLSPVDAAPLLCAGVTTFNALRNSGARGGDLVAVLGVGGLGHLGVQFAAKMGFNTVAVARGKDKEALAKKLGARYYIDSQSQDVSAELTKLGGAKVILATVTVAKAMASIITGLGTKGKLIIVGVPSDPLEMSAFPFIMNQIVVTGTASGASIDSEDTMNFCVQTGIRSMNEAFPLEKAQEAYDHMISGKARFRVVLTTGK